MPYSVYMGSSIWGNFGVSFKHWNLHRDFKFVTLLLMFYLSAIAVLPLTLRSPITWRFPVFGLIQTHGKPCSFLASCSSPWFIDISVYPQQKLEFCTTESVLCFLSVLLSAFHWPRYKLLSFSLYHFFLSFLHTYFPFHLFPSFLSLTYLYKYLKITVNLSVGPFTLLLCMRLSR